MFTSLRNRKRVSFQIKTQHKKVQMVCMTREAGANFLKMKIVILTKAVFIRIEF